MFLHLRFSSTQLDVLLLCPTSHNHNAKIFTLFLWSITELTENYSERHNALEWSFSSLCFHLPNPTIFLHSETLWSCQMNNFFRTFFLLGYSPSQTLVISCDDKIQNLSSIYSDLFNIGLYNCTDGCNWPLKQTGLVKHTTDSSKGHISQQKSKSPHSDQSIALPAFTGT